MNALLRSASVLALAAAAITASAQAPLYDSLNTGSSAVSDGIPNSPYSLFVPTSSGPITGFQLRIFNASASAQPITVRLYADVPPSGAVTTDTVGAQLGIDSVGIAVANIRDQRVLAPTNGVSLVAGTRYWLGLSGSFGGAGSTDVSWYRSAGAPATTIRFLGGYSANDIAYAFVVNPNLNPTPEPSALAALGLGAVAMLKRRKKG